MRVASPGAVATIDRMAKKKPSGEHQKKRIGVNIPMEWHALARKLAGENRQPVLWYLIALLQAEAQKKGYDAPVAPWDEEGEAKK
jgi:hypothetical protein